MNVINKIIHKIMAFLVLQNYVYLCLMEIFINIPIKYKLCGKNSSLE